MRLLNSAARGDKNERAEDDTRGGEWAWMHLEKCREIFVLICHWFFHTKGQLHLFAPMKCKLKIVVINQAAQLIPFKRIELGIFEHNLRDAASASEILSQLGLVK